MFGRHGHCKMKVIKSIGLFFLYPLTMYLLGGVSFLLMNHYFYSPKQAEIEPLPQQLVTEGIPAPAEEMIVEDRQILTSDTQYVIIETDLRDGSSVETTWEVPEKYLGMDRDSFLEAMQEYEQSPPLEEQTRGFVSVEVRSFSRQKVVIRKNYFFEEADRHFYLTVHNNYIVVMCEDMQTVYMNTSISLSQLPERLQAEVLLNKYVETEKELYDFLETYSS